MGWGVGVGVLKEAIKNWRGREGKGEGMLEEKGDRRAREGKVKGGRMRERGRRKGRMEGEGKGRKEEQKVSRLEVRTRRGKNKREKNLKTLGGNLTKVAFTEMYSYKEQKGIRGNGRRE